MYKKSNIERERVNVRSEPDFYWGNSPVNFMGQNPGGESVPTFPSGGYAPWLLELLIDGRESMKCETGQDCMID